MSEPAAPTAPPAVAPHEPESIATDLSLKGAWRVAGIDGRPLDEPVGLALMGDEDELWWEPRCAGLVRTYRIDGGRIAFAAAQPRQPAGSPTPPVCAIALPPRLSDVTRALDEATHISRTPENGVLIAGPDHSLTLFSQ